MEEKDTPPDTVITTLYCVRCDNMKLEWGYPEAGVLRCPECHGSHFRLCPEVETRRPKKGEKDGPQ